MRRIVLLACAVVFVDTMFYSATSPVLPHLADEFDLSKGAAGILSGSYAAGTLLAALPGGWLAARFGSRRTVLVGLTLMTISGLGFAFANNIVLLDLARFGQGVGGAASWAGAFAWLIGVAPADRRGEMIGTAVGAAVGGALFGPVLGAGAQAIGRGPMFSTVAIFGIGLAFWAFRAGAEPQQLGVNFKVLAQTLRRPMVLAGIWLVAVPSVLAGMINVLLPLRIDSLGGSATLVAATYICATLFELVITTVSGRISDRRGRLFPSAIGLAGGVATGLLLPLPGDPVLLAVTAVVMFPLFGFLWSPAMALLADGAEAAGLDQGMAGALLNAAWAGGQLSGAGGGAWIGQHVSDTAAYLLVAGVSACTLAVLLKRVRARPELLAAAEVSG